MDPMEQNACLEQTERNDKRNIKSKYENLKSKITLEPMWFGVTCSMMISIVAFKNLFLQRACLVDLGYSEDVCFRSEGEMKLTVELQSQKIVSSILVGSGLVSGFITIIIVIFLGPWSDSSGRRKPLILMPIIGMACASLTLLIMQAFPYLSTSVVVYAHALPLAMGGHFSILGVAAFSYLGDICYKTGRCATTVMGSNSGFFSFSMVIGTLLGPIIYRTMGFTGLFAVCLLLELSSLFYALFKVEDIDVAKTMPKILDHTLPYQAIKCTFKKREGHKRRNILLMVIVPCCNSMMYVSEIAISYLYLRNKFSWTEVEYSALLTTKCILHVIGTFLIVSVLKRKFKMKDQHIGLLGGISQLFAALAYMFSTNTYLIFGTTIFGIFIRGALIAERPVLNKQIVANEQGKVTCVTSMLEKILSFIIMPLANFLYSITLTWFPSGFLVIVVFAALVQIFCYALVKLDDEKDTTLNGDIEPIPNI